jgi:hypothetical protein
VKEQLGMIVRSTPLITVALTLLAAPLSADTLSCNLTGYKAIPGLTATTAGDSLALAWDADRGQEMRLRLGLERGTPTIRELAIRRNGGQWTTVVTNATPEFRIVSGFRRITNQQLQPLYGLKVPVTQDVVDREKWNAFWDAPLDLSPKSRAGNPPPVDGIAQQPGLPRRPDEIRRASAVYRADRCDVTTNGARMEVSFPGVQLGLFAGRLQFTVYRGTSLLRVETIASTTEPSVAYKYDAGLSGLTIDDRSRVVWRDLSNLRQDYRLGGAPNEREVPLKASNRLVAAETRGGSIAAFPPPHTFFWTREVETNLGYGWYRKDNASSYSFGIRQAEREEAEEYQANFSLYSAPPGSVQRMPVYFYVSGEPAAGALDGAMAFTRNDRYKALPGHQVMASHFHMNLAQRLRASGSLDNRLHDLEALKATGINIVSPTDRPAAATRLNILADYFEAVRRHSDRDFLIMPNEEVSEILGGHWDILFSKPVYWTRDRKPGQALVEDHPTLGRVYRVGNPADIMEMARRENALVFMPHPRTKGSTGYPDAVKDTEHFKDERYRGMGWRWGMGLDLSEKRLSDYRVMPLFDDMNNWMADLPTPPKYLMAITETYEKEPGDDIYANNPVNYLKIAAVPPPSDMSPVIDALRTGEYFVTSGEVLIPTYAVRGAGPRRTIVADLEWTFPLEFVEVVWGDGVKTDRQVISATHLPPFGRHTFEIPFSVAGKKWVRFAAWDSAGNGAFVQPIKLTAAPDAR